MKLTRSELVYLSDALSMNSPGPNSRPDGMASGEAGSRAYPWLLLKIGSAFLDGLEGPPVTIQLAEEEIWIIREVAKTGVMIGGEKVGLDLAVKCYTGLRELTASHEIHEAVIRVGDGAQDPAITDGQLQGLEQLKKENG